MSDWIDIKLQLPSPNAGILVTDGKVITCASLDFDERGPWYWDGHCFGGYEWEFDFSSIFSDGEITHWMPLPALPEK